MRITRNRADASVRTAGSSPPRSPRLILTEPRQTNLIAPTPPDQIGTSPETRPTTKNPPKLITAAHAPLLPPRGSCPTAACPRAGRPLRGPAPTQPCQPPVSVRTYARESDHGHTELRQPHPLPRRQPALPARHQLRHDPPDRHRAHCRTRAATLARPQPAAGGKREPANSITHPVSKAPTYHPAATAVSRTSRF